MTKLRARDPKCGMNVALPDRRDRTWASKSFRVRKVGALRWRVIKNLVAFAHSIGVPSSGLFNVAAGRKRSCHGWESRRVGDSEESWAARRSLYLLSTHVVERKPRVGMVSRQQRFEVVTPDMILNTVPSLYQYIRAAGFDKAAVYRALRKNIPYRGYRFRRLP
ncbi:MAG: hypothetical protein BWY85_00164 [Firmicutes bacterium ADurb.Bin506]|nr:MAG: hypothetical protein BWY85_00164 [Firmicutes bacterium ADurb.Bin506]